MTPFYDRLDAMLTRLKLTAIRNQRDALLDEAARRELTLPEALAFLCEAEIARKDEHSHVLTIRCDSYRLRAKRRAGIVPSNPPTTT